MEGPAHDATLQAATEARDALDAQPPPHARYLWAMLLARIDEVFPVLCPQCGEPMGILARRTSKSGVIASDRSLSAYMNSGRLTTGLTGNRRLAGVTAIARRLLCLPDREPSLMSVTDAY
ncbi:MAG: hypothetical protein ACREV4_03790 [Gammaproteobacteria bacterium]